MQEAGKANRTFAYQKQNIFENENEIDFNVENEYEIEKENENFFENEMHMTMPTPKTSVRRDDEDLAPVSSLVAKKIQMKESGRLLRSLFDSGGTGCMIHANALPLGACPAMLDTPKEIKTIEGTFNAKRRAYLEDVFLPEFDKTKRVDGIWAYAFDTPRLPA